MEAAKRNEPSASLSDEKETKRPPILRLRRRESRGSAHQKFFGYFF
jgi:hypothetical protein